MDYFNTQTSNEAQAIKEKMEDDAKVYEYSREKHRKTSNHLAAMLIPAILIFSLVIARTVSDGIKAARVRTISESVGQMSEHIDTEEAALTITAETTTVRTTTAKSEATSVTTTNAPEETTETSASSMPESFYGDISAFDEDTRTKFDLTAKRYTHILIEEVKEKYETAGDSLIEEVSDWSRFEVMDIFPDFDLTAKIAVLNESPTEVHFLFEYDKLEELTNYLGSLENEGFNFGLKGDGWIWFNDSSINRSVFVFSYIENSRTYLFLVFSVGDS